MTLLIIGAGNMGMAYTKAMIQHNIVSPENITLVDKIREKLAEAEEFGIKKNTAVLDKAIVAEADVILLAVKPQDAKEVFAELKGKIAPHQIVISIMAGMRTSILKEQMAISKVVRAMPNLPLLVGKGMTVFVAQGYADSEKKWIDRILRPTGELIEVNEEEMIDAATAVSGSGPAYVFYFIQQMMNAAMQMGFAEKDAFTLTLQTFKGAIELLEHYDFSCNEWIQKVSSKGGTTERAIAHFRQEDMGKIIAEGMLAAMQRSKELSNA